MYSIKKHTSVVQKEPKGAFNAVEEALHNHFINVLHIRLPFS